MDPVPVRRRSQGTAGKPPGHSATFHAGSGMKNSISRPDSFLPNNGVSLNNPASEPSLAVPFNSHAATSGSEICRDRLIHLLGSVVDEYDKVVKENARLRLQIAQLTQAGMYGSLNEGSGSLSGPYQPQQQQPSRLMTTGLAPSSKFLHSHMMVSNDDTQSPPQTSSVDNSFHKLKILKEEQLQKFKTTSRRKIASATSRLRNVPTTEAQIVRSYARHNDGVWDIAAPKFSTCPYTVFGSASADRTACIWNAKSGHCLMQYQGHDGSVNSIRFQPVRVSAGDSLLVLTASGDQTAHVWKITSAQLAESRESDEEKTTDTDNPSAIHQTTKSSKMLVNYPLMVFRSHTSAVSCAEWISGAHQVITASWDRSAIVFDIETGDNLNSFAGHDDELTYVAVCRPQKLFVTCSKDTTFRLWDLREPNLQSVSVFQGHSDAVNCAVFTPGGDSIVSGGDDKFLRVWDLRNMRSPKASVRMEGGVNRLSVSEGMVVCCPLDNRNVALYSISTGKLTRLPRAKHQGHQRMVTAASWLEDLPSGSPAGSALDINLLTCGFDRQVLGWKTAPLSL